MYKVQERQTRHNHSIYEGLTKKGEVEPGVTVFAVVHERTSLEFAYAYTRRDMAERIAEKFSCNPPALEPNFSSQFILVSDRAADGHSEGY